MWLAILKTSATVAIFLSCPMRSFLNNGVLLAQRGHAGQVGEDEGVYSSGFGLGVRGFRWHSFLFLQTAFTFIAVY